MIDKKALEFLGNVNYHTQILHFGMNTYNSDVPYSYTYTFQVSTITLKNKKEWVICNVFDHRTIFGNPLKTIFYKSLSTFLDDLANLVEKYQVIFPSFEYSSSYNPDNSRNPIFNFTPIYVNDLYIERLVKEFSTLDFRIGSLYQKYCAIDWLKYLTTNPYAGDTGDKYRYIGLTLRF